ncbi:hypothetical protein [Streptomyces nanshensis]|uniref:Uncharacterized protein n=1 Tax=Streptomyces nanshensis TaxID=518642 RepID=A0A1E7LDM3_9ACTN|nr:hypothetical protein [Streptomyces nanshensis]OEV14063.1 hypothetical protein AN218_00900 [Streptomyces nanshensis]
MTATVFFQTKPALFAEPEGDDLWQHEGHVDEATIRQRLAELDLTRAVYIAPGTLTHRWQRPVAHDPEADYCAGDRCECLENDAGWWAPARPDEEGATPITLVRLRPVDPDWD